MDSDGTADESVRVHEASTTESLHVFYRDSARADACPLKQPGVLFLVQDEFLRRREAPCLDAPSAQVFSVRRSKKGRRTVLRDLTGR